MKAIRIQAATAVLMLAVMVLGCTGPEGPAGRDAVGVDTQPPDILMTRPVPGDTIRSDTLKAWADAIDNVGVDRVAFYLDGSDIIKDSTKAWVRQPPYAYNFDLSDLGLVDGPHTIAARAYDLSGNSQTTPTLLFHYDVPDTGTAFLRSFNLRDPDFTQWQLVQHTVLQDTSGEDSLVITPDSFAVRFDAASACQLLRVRAFIDSIPGDSNYTGSENWGAGITILVAESNGALAEQLVDSGAVRLIQPADTLSPYGWREVNLPPSEPAFDSLTTFHLVFAVEGPDSMSFVALRAEPKPAHNSPPYLVPLYNHTHVYKRDDEVWESFQAVYPQQGAWEFWVEAVVDYGDGSSAVLRPAPIIVTDSR